MSPLQVTEIFWRAEPPPPGIDPRDAEKVRLGEGQVCAARSLVIGGCRLTDGRLLLGHPGGDCLTDAATGAVLPWRGHYGVFAERAQRGEDAEGLIVTRQDWYGVVDYGLLLGADQPFPFVGMAQRAVETRFREHLALLLASHVPISGSERALCQPAVLWERFRHAPCGDGHWETALPRLVVLVNGTALPVEGDGLCYPVPTLAGLPEELRLTLALTRVVSRSSGGWQAPPAPVHPHPMDAMLDLQANVCRQLAHAMQALLARCERA